MFDSTIANDIFGIFSLFVSRCCSRNEIIVYRSLCARRQPSTKPRSDFSTSANRPHQAIMRKPISDRRPIVPRTVRSVARIGLAATFLAAAIGIPQARAEVALAAPLSDGAVLQRNKPIMVWGTAEPGEPVAISFKGQSRATHADGDGRWSVQLDAEPASVEPATISVKGDNAISVHDVLVGEVWICSGQSNMNHPVMGARDAQQEIAAATYPLIRHFAVSSTISPEPLDAASGEWQSCSPQTAGSFAAVGYFFARELHRELGVPVGIIKSTLGGSPIEAWISNDALASTPASLPAIHDWTDKSSHWQLRAADYTKQLGEWQARAAEAAASGKKYLAAKPAMSYDEGDRGMPGGLFNGFIHPLRRFSIAGFLWYQGESNAHRADDYRILFPLLIRQWRRSFQGSELPFLFVQLPNFIDSGDHSNQNWARLRAAQATTLSEPHTGMAVTIDVGDPHDLHPANKQDVGRRLALVALRQVYRRQVADSGPNFRALERCGATLAIHFDHAQGLKFEGDPAAGFEISRGDEQFVPATASIESESVVLSASGGQEALTVRFAWQNNPSLVLTNSAGLPAAPFQADEADHSP
jgi:sialate O-acetylesterase